MHGPGFFFLIIFFILPLAVVAGVIWLLARLIRGVRRQDDEVMDEARTIQELYQGLNRMEQRVEALETLLLDRGAREGDK